MFTLFLRKCYLNRLILLTHQLHEILHTIFSVKNVNIFPYSRQEMWCVCNAICSRWFRLVECNTFDGWEKNRNYSYIQILRYCISHSTHTHSQFIYINIQGKSYFDVSMFESPPSLFTCTIYVCAQLGHCVSLWAWIAAYISYMYVRIRIGVYVM